MHCAHVVAYFKVYNMCTVHVLFSHNEITTFRSTQNDHSRQETRLFIYYLSTGCVLVAPNITKTYCKIPKVWTVPASAGAILNEAPSPQLQLQLALNFLATFF